MANEWWEARCNDCGHQDSSEHFLGDEYDTALVLCPKCYGWNIVDQAKADTVATAAE